MIRVVFLSLLALLSVTDFASGMNLLPSLQHARTGDIQQLCQWFCGENDYPDYFFFRGLEEKMHPRIFCGLCKKKLGTTTPAPRSSTTPKKTEVMPASKVPSSTVPAASTIATSAGVPSQKTTPAAATSGAPPPSPNPNQPQSTPNQPATSATPKVSSQPMTSPMAPTQQQ